MHFYDDAYVAKGTERQCYVPPEPESACEPVPEHEPDAARTVICFSSAILVQGREVLVGIGFLSVHRVSSCEEHNAYILRARGGVLLRYLQKEYNIDKKYIDLKLK